MNTEEPLLTPDDTRFVVLPVCFQDLYQMYKRAVVCFWTAEEVELSKDLVDWVRMTNDKKHFVSLFIVFFSINNKLYNILKIII